MAEGNPPTVESTEAQAILLGPNARFVRQMDFVPLETLESRPITIIGVGAIGRQVALQLAAIGVREFLLIDFDTVTPTNVTTQGFLAKDIGKEKVIAVAEAILDIDPSIKVYQIVDRFRPNQKVSEVVFLCVDKIEARTAIYKALRDKTEIIVDGRMLGETMQVLVAHDEESRKYYETTLFSKEEQAQGRCTGHATIYCASIAAGLMVHQFTRHLRSFMMDNHMGLNLLSGELLPITF
jgi:molybdopterin-synthase adenylyltransferase